MFLSLDNNEVNEVEVYQESDFKGEIQESVDRINNNEIESPYMDKEKTIEIMKVIKEISL